MDTIKNANRSIKFKILSMIGILIAMISIIVFTNNYSMIKIENYSKKLIDEDVAIEIYTLEAIDTLYQARLNEKSFLFTRDEKYIKNFEENENSAEMYIGKIVELSKKIIMRIFYRLQIILIPKNKIM